jgi:hypothetical protein
MPALSPDKLVEVLEALRVHRNALRAAKLTGVAQTTAWRIAKKHGISLISQAEHWKSRRFDPAFVAKHASAVRKTAGRWLKARLADPEFRKKAVEAGRRHAAQLHSDPAFRQAGSERFKRLHQDPAFRAKLYAALSASHAERRRKRRAKAVKAALRALVLYDADPHFRRAASERLSRFVPTIRAKGKE